MTLPSHAHQLALRHSSDSRPERCPPPRPAAARLLLRSAPRPDQRHAHGPAPRGLGCRSPLDGAPSRALCTGPSGISSRRLLSSPCGRRSQRHQLTVLATHPGHHPRHHGGLVAMGAGAARRPRLSAQCRSPLAFPARLRLAISDPVLIVSGIQHQRAARPLCPCARPYHGPSHVPTDLAALSDQSSSRRGEGLASQNGPPRTTSVVSLTPCGTCPRAGPSASFARASRRRRPARSANTRRFTFCSPSGRRLSPMHHSLTGPPALRLRTPHLGRTAHLRRPARVGSTINGHHPAPGQTHWTLATWLHVRRLGPRDY